MGTAPFTDDERRLVAELHAEGKGRNRISRESGIHQKQFLSSRTLRTFPQVERYKSPRPGSNRRHLAYKASALAN